MLSLIFPKTQLTSASIPVRWCIDEAAYTETHADGLKPFILIRINYDRGYESSFYLYPLDQYSAYLDIHYPGKITIQGYLVTTSDDKKDSIQQSLIESSYHRRFVYPHYEYNLDQKRNGRVISRVDIRTYDCSEEYNFDIDTNLFGKELPEWLKFFVNRYWYESKPKDQCAQRRRLMLFPFTNLLLILIEFVFRFTYNFILTATCWLIGAHPGFEFILHPFDNTMSKRDLDQSTHMFTAIADAKWMTKHKDSTIVAAAVGQFIPIVYLTCYGIALLCNYTFVEAIYAAFGLYWIGIIIAAIIILVAFGIHKFADKAGQYIQSRWPALVNKLCTIIDNVVFKLETTIDKLRHILDSWLADDTEHQRTLLLCHDESGECLPKLTVRDKPVTLIFADIKNKVCKPMRG